jgi:hypothetical protein
MSSLILISASFVGQWFYPTAIPYYEPNGYPLPYGAYGTPLPIFDPVRYQLRYDGYGAVMGPFAPLAGPPRTIGFPNPGLEGRIVSVDDKERVFVVDLPNERVKVHYGPETLWLGKGKLETGRLVKIDQMNRSVKLE